MPSTEQLKQGEPVQSFESGRPPLIDCRALLRGTADEKKQVADKIGAACRDPGFFTALNIGIDDETTRQLLGHMATFFALADSDSVKQAVCADRSQGGYGWRPLYREPAYQAGTIAHVESFDCGPPAAHFEGESSPPEHALGNLWPDIPGFHEATRLYWHQAERFAERLFEALAASLGLAPGFFASRCTPRAPNTLRLLNYPANDHPSDDTNVGIAAHTDFECLTVLYQTSRGLELRDVHGQWYEAPHETGRYVVILGDMLERWTNGYLQATGHRVPNTPWTRQSVVLFFAADAEGIVEPLSQFVDAKHPARYAAVTQQEHIDRELERARKHRDGES